MPKNSPGRFKRKCNNPEHREWCGTEPWSDGLKLTKGVSVKLRRAFISLETGRHRIDTKTKFCTGCISLAEEKLGICMVGFQLVFLWLHFVIPKVRYSE